MNTMYRVDFVLKAETDYARTEAMLDRHFNCEENCFVKESFDNMFSFGSDLQSKLKAIALEVLDDLLYPCFISVIWTDIKAWESIDLLEGYEWDRTDKHCSAVYKSVFMISRFCNPDYIIDKMENGFDYISHPHSWIIDGNVIEFSTTDPKYMEEFLLGTWGAFDGFIPDCFTGVYWYDIRRGICDNLLRQVLLGIKHSGINLDDNYIDEDNDFPYEITMKAVYTIKEDCDHNIVKKHLDIIYRTQCVDVSRRDLSACDIEYTIQGKSRYYCSHIAVYRAVNSFLRDYFVKVEFTVVGEGYDKQVDVLTATEHDLHVNTSGLIKEAMDEEGE